MVWIHLAFTQAKHLGYKKYISIPKQTRNPVIRIHPLNYLENFPSHIFNRNSNELKKKKNEQTKKTSVPFL